MSTYQDVMKLVRRVQSLGASEDSKFVLDCIKKGLEAGEKEIAELNKIEAQFKEKPILLNTGITPEMRDFYSRGWLDMNEGEFLKRANTLVAIFGAGMSSNLPKRLVKSGVLNHIICDGDSVELQNLIRQEFKRLSIGKNKAQSLSQNLREDFPFANIFPYPYFLNRLSLEFLLKRLPIQYVVNAIDFDSPAFIDSHKLARKYSKLEFFPFTLGSLGVVIVNDSTTPDFADFFKSENFEEIEAKIVEFCFNQIIEEVPASKKQEYLQKLQTYKSLGQFYESQPTSQRAVSKSMDIVTDLIVEDLQGELLGVPSEIKKFPKIYFR